MVADEKDKRARVFRKTRIYPLCPNRGKDVPPTLKPSRFFSFIPVRNILSLLLLGLWSLWASAACPSACGQRAALSIGAANPAAQYTRLVMNPLASSYTMS
jgi:hypothetical protein